MDMDALGIINFEDGIAAIDGLGDYRPVPAVSFMGRYRIIDFILSNMTNSGISHVQVFCKEKPRNLIEHLGTGTNYNINGKRGRLRILYGEKPFSSPVYNNDAANFSLNMQYIETDPNPYVIVAPSYFVYSFDFNEVMKRHKESGADVTVLYKATSEARTKFLGCDVITMEKEHRVTSFGKNHGTYKNRFISLEAYIMTKRQFVDLVRKATSTSSLYWLKDILAQECGELNIQGYPMRRPVYCLNSLTEYYRASMELRDINAAKQLFLDDWPIYTQTNDSCPTRFTETGSAVNSIVANGSVIEGHLDGCIVGRNVRIRKGVSLKDCVILADARIEQDVRLKSVIVDKYAKVEHVKNLEGTPEQPLYVRRRDRI